MAKNTTSLTAIVITNPDWFFSTRLLSNCLDSVNWADEIIILSSKKTEELEKIAKKFHARLTVQKGDNFAEWRNYAASLVKTVWMLYIDTDECITDELKKEILKVIKKSPGMSAYAIPRSNVILGKEMRHAGWWPDFVLRLIQKEKLQSWQGALHEQPQIDGEVGHLHQNLLHYKHETLEDMLEKTLHWSKSEAKLYAESNHPNLNIFRFYRLSIVPFLSSFIKRYFIQKGYKDGTEGLIDAIYQSYSQFLSYAQLWQLQLERKKI